MIMEFNLEFNLELRGVKGSYGELRGVKGS